MLLSPAHIATWSIAALAILGVIIRPWKLPEALWAVLAAAALLVFGLISLPDAGKAVWKGVDVYLFLIGMMVLADDGLLCVAMENLLGNAWKYTSKRARAMIEFGSMESGGETVFFVRDNGAGFDPAYSDRLFQPFQRLHVQSEFPGTGVGLATVTRIIARHEGRIWAESAVGKGATFYFTLPYAGSKQREQPRFSKN